jgi:hypothetical protein
LIITPEHSDQANARVRSVAFPDKAERISDQPKMARVFLSCVTEEFGSYRRVLFDDLMRPGVEVETQERFLAYGAETLLKLDHCIATCEAVIHEIRPIGANAELPCFTWPVYEPG